MDRILFEEIFDSVFLQNLREIESNNSLIKLKSNELCKDKLYRSYTELNELYKEAVFKNKSSDALLDRHKVAACVCGAFLKFPVFDDSELYRHYEGTGEKTAVFFFYSNEEAALLAGVLILKLFMMRDRMQEEEKVEDIRKVFPVMPPPQKNKVGIINSILFNLYQVRNNSKIGVEHFDVFSYAMLFFWIESYFYQKIGWN